MNKDGNFKVKCIKTYPDDKRFIEGKTYEYVNGKCMLEDGFTSGYYMNYKDFNDLIRGNGSYRPYIVEVKESVFNPIKVRVASICNEITSYFSKVGLRVCEIDKDICDIDILDFFSIDFNGEFIEKVIIRDYIKGTKYNKSTKTLTIGKEYKYYEDLYSFESNAEAIKFSYEITKVIEAINERLVNESKDIKIYAIKHTPDGKRYFFRSKEELTHGDLVYCDTYAGLAYGVVDGIEYENIRKFISRKQCSKDQNNLK